ncbi:MAG TPA: helix-turn-helix transcriptional regulator [Ignavibacteria bacterium]|nr:helix-turn-helix transcriptional regulator [Ignavibacteria bacterium]HMR41097.1 helix-turn-helix transcriptional regulator [Ignavibacteria bacterium]
MRLKVKHPLLKDHIEKVSILRSQIQSDKQYSVLPDGMTELIINTGNPYDRTAGNEIKSIRIKGSHFVGIKSRHCIVKPDRIMNTLNIRFKPGAASLFTRSEADETRDRIVDAELIFGKEIRKLESEFFSEQDPDMLLSKVEQFLLSKLRKDEKAVMILKQARSVYKTSGYDHQMFNVKISDLNTGNISSKSLERIYRQYIGLTPKQFINVVRFNYSTKLLFKDNSNLTDIGYRSGYFDQSHFIHSFKKFSGRSPGNYDFYSSKTNLVNQIIINAQFGLPQEGL